MTEKSKWKTTKTVWGAVVTFSVILGIFASILQISGAVDFRALLVLPLYDFLVTNVPIYYAVLFVIAFMITLYSATKLRKRYESCILDLEDGRRIALLCQTSRTTEFIRRRYDYWESQSTVAFVDGYNFNDYMKRLEKEGFLEYIDGNWQVTRKALEYIHKYHGD